MNVKSNKGFAGIDISVAMILILIFVPTIFAGTYGIKLFNESIARESYAINLATEVLDTARTLEYDKVNLEDKTTDGLLYKLRTKNIK